MVRGDDSRTLDQEVLSIRLAVTPDEPIFLALVGELDMASVPILTTILRSLVDEGVHHVVVDAQEVGFCGADGVRALLAAHRKINRVGSVFAIVPSQSIQRLTTLLGLDEELSLFPTLSAALMATKANQQIPDSRMRPGC